MSRNLHSLVAALALGCASGPGPIFRRLRDAFDRYKAELTGQPW